MTPTPGVFLEVMAVTAGLGLVLALAVVTVARIALPRIDGWCGRHEFPLIAALALSEDAALPPESKRRARDLFFAKLDARQRRRWHLRRRLEVTAPSGRRYVISPYKPFNIRSRDAVFCIAVDGAIPVYDKLLAQKLLLESDEQRFLARANVRTFSGTWKALVAAARDPEEQTIFG
jgi:hypothetical protein